MATDVNKLRCIFFSEFHPITGPKVTFQAPEDFITKELFDQLHVYIITKSELNNKLITINAHSYKIIGCPIGIEDDKYSRNVLHFNLAFVLDITSSTKPYQPLVKKLAGYLTTLELECGFLSNEESKALLPDIMKQLLSNLNEHGKCSIPINDSNTIHLKIVPPMRDPPPVFEHQVPMFLKDKSSYDFNDWDLTTQQILPYIDGINHVQRIAVEADVDLNLVKTCLQNLLYYGVITTVPIFQQGHNEMPAPPPTFRSVFKLYCGLRPATTVKDLCARYDPRSLRINERHLIQFGVMKGLLRRLQKYPVKIVNDPAQQTHDIHKYMTGQFNFDEICCKTKKSSRELDEIVNQEDQIVVCWK
ncbi:GATOR complex protein NPRL2-like [Anneissia japonica]|uniref:GATOR complex protein NPRL2-like n=1 Tax=Anneissia japonica TaxID=1529436 RepID=UPI0014257A46|nr:GATOR complex protein NPRL2-like [Anneissia japonica]